MRNQKNKYLLRHVGERGIIKTFLPDLANLGSRHCVVPPGDDAVVLRSPGRPVLSIDGLTEGTHFKLSWARRVKQLTGISLGRMLAWKLLGCSLSDLAAMGGASHRWAMIYMGSPGSVPVQFLRNFYKGTKDAARWWNCTLAGGDTVRAKDLSLVSAVGGLLGSGRILKRSGARIGDVLCIAGDVGDAAVGLQILEGKLTLPKKSASYFVRRFFKHEPLFHESSHLRMERGVSSLMDLSDSLGESVQLLCEASGKGAMLDLDLIPVSKIYRMYFPSDEKLLIGGEDYGLLFTVSRSAIPRLRQKIKFSVIGIMTPENQKIQILKRKKPVRMPRFFEHF